MKLIEPVLVEYLEFCELKEVSAASCGVYGRHIRAWLCWRAANGHANDLASVGAAELRAYFLYLKRDHVPHGANSRRPAVIHQVGLSAASRNQSWRILAGFWTYLADSDQLAPAQRDLFSARRVPCPAVPLDYREAVSAADVQRLIAACAGSDERSCRDRAILLMLEQTGMRVSELCDLRDVQMNLVDRRAQIMGKGHKPRWVFWGASAAEALNAYLYVRRRVPGGYCFRGMSSRSRGRFSAGAVRDMIKARAAAAGVVLPAGAPCHGFRHGFARRSLEHGWTDSIYKTR